MKCINFSSKKVFFALVLTVLPSAAFGLSSVTLAWNAVTNATGYKLYYGRASRVYTNSVDAGAAMTKGVSNLVSGATYFFAATAYNSFGESDYSVEISYIAPPSNAPPPVITLVSPVSGATFANPASIGTTAAVVTNSHVFGKVELYCGSNCLGQASSTPLSFTWTNVSSGTYSLRARLTYDGSVTMDSAVAVVTVADPLPPGPLVLRLIRSATNTFILSATGTPSQAYKVQASQDFVHWNVLGTVTNDGSGSFAYVDRTSAAVPVRYYRLQVLGP